MSLIHKDGIIGPQTRIRLGLHKQDAVGHQFDKGMRTAPVFKTDLVSHRPAHRFPQFLSDPLGDGHGSDAPRLGAADDAPDASPCFQTHLGDLGRLSRAGFTGDHDDLMPLDRPDDILSSGGNRQGCRIADLGKRAVLSQFFVQGGNLFYRLAPGRCR